MEAAAHTRGGFGGVPQAIGRDFSKADKGKKFGRGKRKPPGRGKRKSGRK
jgi:hypothetical protein